MKKLVSAIAIVFCIVAATHATTVERLTLDGLVRKSNSIVVGRVMGSRTYWSPNGKVILTTTTMEVQETMKGPSRTSIEITTIGGRVGSTILHVAGMPAFYNGEQAVVFVEQSNAYTTVVGLAQGKFVVDGGEVANNVAGLEFPDFGPGRPTRMQLDAFKSEIRKRLNR